MPSNIIYYANTDPDYLIPARATVDNVHPTSHDNFSEVGLSGRLGVNRHLDDNPKESTDSPQGVLHDQPWGKMADPGCCDGHTKISPIDHRGSSFVGLKSKGQRSLVKEPNNEREKGVKTHVKESEGAKAHVEKSESVETHELAIEAEWNAMRQSHATRPARKLFNDIVSRRPVLRRLGIPVYSPRPQYLFIISAMLASVACASIIIHMMAGAGGGGGGGGGSDVAHRVPPKWSPDSERTYSFRTYTQEVILWTMLTDLQPHQQAAAIILRLGGTAREVARALTINEIINGGVIGGRQLEPVAYLLATLASRYAMLGEETRLQAMTDLMSFQRRHGENINDILARFDNVRFKAQNEGQFVMSYEGYSLHLLRAVGVGHDHLMTLLQPFGGRLPTDQLQFEQMTAQMRRLGHILEHAPHSVASTIGRGADRHQHHFVQAFVANTQTQFSGHGCESSDHQVPRSDPDHTFWSQMAPGYNLDENPWSPSGEGAYMSGAGTSDTDTATISDDCTQAFDAPGLRGLTDQEIDATLYWGYHKAKTQWRRRMARPSRKVRRVFRKKVGKHSYNRQGRAHGARHYFQKRSKKHSSGFGTGKRTGKNPRGKDGKIMKCLKCGSEDHFQAECPMNQSHFSHGGTAAPSVGPEASHHSEQASSRTLFTNRGESVQQAIQEVGPFDDLFDEPSNFTFMVSQGGSSGQPSSSATPAGWHRASETGSSRGAASASADPLFEPDLWSGVNLPTPPQNEVTGPPDLSRFGNVWQNYQPFVAPAPPVAMTTVVPGAEAVPLAPAQVIPNGEFTSVDVLQQLASARYPARANAQGRFNAQERSPSDGICVAVVKRPSHRDHSLATGNACGPKAAFACGIADVEDISCLSTSACAGSR